VAARVGVDRAVEGEGEGEGEGEVDGEGGEGMEERVDAVGEES
jgi:hypothetical protein